MNKYMNANKTVKQATKTKVKQNRKPKQLDKLTAIVHLS